MLEKDGFAQNYPFIVGLLDIHQYLLALLKKSQRLVFAAGGGPVTRMTVLEVAEKRQFEAAGV